MAHRDPMAEVFRLPELVSLIVHHRMEPYFSGEKKQYWHLACVARNWLDPVTSIAWRHLPLRQSSNWLEKVEPGRRQYYADQVRDLRIVYSERTNEQLSTVSFRKLESLQISNESEHEFSPSAEEWVHSLLVPSIRSLDLRSEHVVPKDLAVSSANLCPNVKKLQLTLRENDQTSIVMLADIVEALPQLRELKLDSQLHPAESISTERMLSCLSALPHLESLKFEGIIPDLTQISSPFPQLRSLRGEATLPTLLRIGLLTPRLVRLDLEVPPRYVAEPPALVIAPLHSLTELESLTLRVQGDAPLQSKDLETLARFSKLSSLCISPNSGGKRKVPTPDLTDETMCSIFQHLPLMRNLELRLRHPRGPPGGQALLTLVKHCRDIGTIYIPGHYDLEPFLSLPQQPVFPRLKTLCVASLYFRHARPNYQISRIEFKSIVQVLALHAPKLSYLDFPDPWWEIGKRFSAVMRDKRWDAPCGCGTPGEPGETHKHVDHIDYGFEQSVE